MQVICIHFHKPSLATRGLTSFMATKSSAWLTVDSYSEFVVRVVLKKMKYDKEPMISTCSKQGTLIDRLLP